jgi:glutamate N-acetyltransferase / amino-acid N-acetyltransferase
MNQIKGGVTAPKGFRAAGEAAGIKPGSTKRDCALIVSDAPATVAGTFTANVVKAAPVHWCRNICAVGSARAIFANSGNANACTGKQGDDDVSATAKAVGKALGLPYKEICVCSTGVIGVPMPMDRLTQGVTACAQSLAQDGGAAAAEAIMTTDTVPKEISVEVPMIKGTARIGAIAKGSGMIAPGMATMLCFITTDVAIAAQPLQRLLRQAVDRSFNRMCVDNDMSTNDTVLVLANGESGIPTLGPGSSAYAAFGSALASVCEEMAKTLVRDGEGATKFVEIQVSGADSNEDALAVARSVATSQLCKTAFFGQDPNWGRLACAAGYAGVEFDPNRLAIRLDDVQVFDGGMPTAYEEKDAAAAMRKPEFVVALDLGGGPGSAVFWTSDLSHDYVTINADYRT